jgi:citrate lyase subunit beta/citryl-CoA lyase
MDGTKSPPRLRRSLLIVPGNRVERIAKAATLPVDAVVMDLEDGVVPAEKPAARAAVGEALRTLAFAGRERIVRINAVGSEPYHDDLAALDLSPIDALFVPKVESPDQLRGLAAWLEAKEGERQRPVEIIATIETPRGLLRALDIADATTRTTALFFGSGDYTAATGSAVTERSLAVPRALVVAAAAAAGIDAIDAAEFNDVRSADAARADAHIARELGFAGKLVFHPNQIAPVNEVFTPTEAEVSKARRIIAAYEAARAEGRGTAVVDGVFVAVDIMAMAVRTIARAELAALRRS